MNAEEIWDRYKKVNPNAVEYDAWCFAGGGEVGDRLADLVIRGIKTATASAHQLYQIEKSPIPAVGKLDIILKDNGEAVCIIKNLDVHICKFNEVSPEHAYLEGEGDRSLEYWRRVHEEFFTEELEEKGLHFDEQMLVVCERFMIEFR